MKKYKVQITNKALSDMEKIYNYISEELQIPEVAIRQYNRIAEKIETLENFPERVKLMDSKQERSLGIRQMLVDNYSVFFHIINDRVIVTNVLYSKSDISIRLKDI